MKNTLIFTDVHVVIYSSVKFKTKLARIPKPKCVFRHIFKSPEIMSVQHEHNNLDWKPP